MKNKILIMGVSKLIHHNKFNFFIALQYLLIPITYILTNIIIPLAIIGTIFLTVLYIKKIRTDGIKWGFIACFFANIVFSLFAYIGTKYSILEPIFLVLIIIISPYILYKIFFNAYKDISNKSTK